MAPFSWKGPSEPVRVLMVEKRWNEAMKLYRSTSVVVEAPESGKMGNYRRFG
jgi:hypothetical protein